MGEIIYEALAQYITIFFFVVMVLPAVIIFCGYLIYIVVMCIRELKKNSFHLYGKSTDAGPPASVLFMTFYFFIAAAEASSFSMRARSLAASSRAPLTTASGALAIKP